MVNAQRGPVSAGLRQDLAAKLAQNLINVIAGTSIRGSTTSITIADPGLFDCPLVAVSEGFEQITGYRQEEIVGRNCRFLNEGCTVDEDIRFEMRKCVNFGNQFLCVLNNRTRQGVPFRNLLHMTTMRVGKRAFIVGIQCDVTHTDFNQSNKSHVLELQQVVDRIFAANLDAWIGQAASDFQASLPVPYSKILKDNYEDEYNAALNHFVGLETDIASANTNIILISQKNTFVHAEEVSRESFKLKRSISDSHIRLSFHESIEDTSTTASTYEPDAETSSVKQMPSPALLSSVGSMGHPDGRCTPCKFFVDPNKGCDKGYDCRFCHEVHTKKKKKRKAKAEAPGANIADSVVSEGGYPISPAANSKSDHQSQLPEPNQQSQNCQLAAGSDQCALTYMPPYHSTLQSCRQTVDEMQSFSFAIGQSVALPAVLSHGQQDMKSMQQALSFSVSPVLPAGLSLNKKTGDISGTVQLPPGKLPNEGHRSMHRVEVRIKVMAAGSHIPLGEVALCEAQIQIRILDISVLLSQIRWIEAGEGMLNVKCADTS